MVDLYNVIAYICLKLYVDKWLMTESCSEYIVRFGSSKACYQQSNSFYIKII